MGNRAYAARIDRWQSTVNNLAAAVPDIPDADQVYAKARDKVLRTLRRRLKPGRRP